MRRIIGPNATLGRNIESHSEVKSTEGHPMSRLKSGMRLLMNPGPTNVHPDVHAAMVIPDMSHRAAPFRDAVSEVISLLVGGLGGTDAYEAVIFVSSGTGANEAMVQTIEGRTLLISKGRYSDRLGEIADRHSIPLHRWECEPYAAFDLNALSEILDRQAEIENLLLVHLETTTGVLLPLEDITRECSRRGIRVYVDAISSVGGHHFDLATCPVTMATITPNKCLEGLPGISFVVMRKDALDDRDALARGGFYLDLREQRRLCRTGRLPYTAAVPAVFAARAALRRWHAEGQARRVLRYERNAKRLRQELMSIGVRLADEPSELSSNIITTVIPGTLFDYSALVDDFERRGIELYSPAAIQTVGRAFFATMGAIEEDDVADFVEALKNYLSCSGRLQ